MKLGLAHVDLTPRPVGELCGFAARTQPGAGVLDPLQAKALFLADGDRRLLWIHCDLIGFDASIVAAFRHWARGELGLPAESVLLTATHTHSGPATLHLEEAGRIDEAYIAFLQDQLRAAARAATAHPEDCVLVTAEGRLDLAIDRRGKPSRHTDPRVTGLGFLRADSTWAAAILHYAIHPVALGSSNRAVSADVLGRAADALSGRLPGHPTVIAVNGACGNLNPPAEDVDYARMTRWGRQIADAIAPALLAARPEPRATFSILARPAPLPREVLDPAGLDACVAAALARGPTAPAWRLKYRGVVERWRAALQADWQAGTPRRVGDVELFAVELGGLVLLGINAEIFSRFGDWIRETSGRRVCVVGYANGNLGYLATREAYAEGGYEVDDAHFFYGGYRFQAGALELLAGQADALLRELPPAAR